MNRIAATCFASYRTGSDGTVDTRVHYDAARLYCNFSRLAADNTATAAARPKCGSTAHLRAPWMRACHTVSYPTALATGSLEDLLQAVHDHALSAHRHMSGVPEGNSTHCQQHNSTPWITLGSVNRLRRPTTAHEVRRTRVLRLSSRLEFTSSTRSRRDGLSSF